MIAALAALCLPRSATLIGVGDVMLARWVGRRIERDGVASPFSKVSSALKSADLTVGNLECVLSTLPFANHKTFLFRADPKVATGLHDAPFSLLSLANNHASDCGPEGLTETAQHLSRVAVSSLLPSGEPVFKSAQGIRFAFLGFSDIPNYPLPPDLPEKMREARAKVDDIVVLVHWGYEGVQKENERQQKLARQLANAGADLVLGSHPHVIQPVKIIRGWKGRKCLVAYSLGNFVFDAPKGLQRKTGALKVTFSIHGVTSYHLLRGLIKNGYPQSLK